MNASDDPRVMFALIDAEGAALDAFFASVEQSRKRHGLTIEEVGEGIRDHFPFGIEVDEAWNEYVEEAGADA